MTKREESEFRGYLRHCTDNQVRGVYEKEKIANRTDYMRLAEIEAAHRGIYLYGEAKVGAVGEALGLLEDR